MQITVANYSTEEDSVVQAVLRAINRQIEEDFRPYWSLTGRLRLGGRTDRIDVEHPVDLTGDGVLYLLDDLDGPEFEGVLGFHTENRRGVPWGFVFTRISAELGEPWSVTASHEALEMLSNRNINQLTAGPDPRPTDDPRPFVLYQFEVCDAVQAESYEIDGIRVSNFVKPLYFTVGEQPGGRNDFLGRAYDGRTLTSFGVNPGGYAAFLDPASRTWETVFADSQAEKRYEIKQRARSGRRGPRYEDLATRVGTTPDVLLALPAGADDFPELRPSWTAYLRNQFQAELLYVRAQYRPFDTYDAALPVHFADPTDGVPAHARAHSTTWSGFPLVLRSAARDRTRGGPGADAVAYESARRLGVQRFVTADGSPVPLKYREQDEYLEWRAETDADGRLVRITFVCEPPDAWSCFADGHPAPYFALPAARGPAEKWAGQLDRVVALYKELVDERVTATDLVFAQDVYLGGELRFRAGDYNPWNRWNVTDGIMHLSHPANTVGQAAQVVGDGSVLRADADGKPLQGARSLLAAGAFGTINRSSDPAIGAAANELARAGYHVTMADPVGVYISHLEDGGWTKPDGSPVPPEYWRVVRVGAGVPGLPGSARTLRAVYEVPAGEPCRVRAEDGAERPMTLSDIRIGGRPLADAGQVADAVRLTLTLVAWPMTQPPPQAVGAQPGSRYFANDDHREILRAAGVGYPEIAPPAADGEHDAFPEVSRSKDARATYLLELGARAGITGPRDWRTMWPDGTEPRS